MRTNPNLIRDSLLALSRTFRGEIWEHNANVPLEGGYANNGKPFDIRTAHYLKPVFRSIRNPVKRWTVCRSAIQTLKTWLVEKSASFLIENDPGDMVIYDCDGEASVDHSKSRLGPLLKSMPGIENMISEVASRHDINIKEYYLPGMTLRIWPLNESSVHRMTLKYVMICDAFLAKNGLIEKAIGRTTQYPNDCKVIVEGQGGVEGDDFDKIYKQTNQARLWVSCPLCKQAQPFEFDRKRPDGTHSGFNKGPDELVLFRDGRPNYAAIERNTHYRCFYCDGVWRDVPTTRVALDESSHYVAEIPAQIQYDGFSWPAWINTRVRWGFIMQEYIKAKKADKELGIRDDFKLWHQRRAALTWSDEVGQFIAKMSDMAYDPSKPMENQVAKIALIDCQFELSHFWVQIWTVDKGSNIRMLARQHVVATPGRTAKQNVEALIASFEVPANCVAIDAQHKYDEVIEWCAQTRYVGPVMRSDGEIEPEGILTWRAMSGTHIDQFRWPDGQVKRYLCGYHGLGNRIPVTIEVNGESFVIWIFHSTISTLRYADIAKRFRDRENAPKMEVLPEIIAEEGRESFQTQMFSEYRTKEKGKDIWKKKTNVEHNHDWDLLKMLIAMMDMMGLLSMETDPLEDKPEPAEKLIYEKVS